MLFIINRAKEHCPGGIFLLLKYYIYTHETKQMLNNKSVDHIQKSTVHYPYYYRLEGNFFSTAEHGGTHFDAPSHFYEGSWRSHQIPVEHLVGPGVIIDVRQQASEDPDYRVTIGDLKQWERRYGKIPKGAVVIMNSGWDKNYPNKSLTFGSDNPHDQTTFHFPGFHEEAADWLIHRRNIHVIGVDTPSLDYGQSITRPVHVIMGKENIPGLENVANLDTIPAAGTIIIAGAIKLYDGSGGPARVIAMLF